MLPGLLRKALPSAIPFLFSILPVFAQFVPNRYILLLEDPPVASRFQKREEMQSGPAIAYRAQIAAKQQNVIRELRSRNIQVTGSVMDLLNAIFVTAPADRVSEMLTIPGVAAARPMRRYHPTLNRATQLMNANPTAWNAVGGQNNAGQGIKIAVVDSGIDNTHPAFQDASLAMPAGFPICSGFSGDCSAYTNGKVIVARSYVQQLAGFSADGSTPPDPATSTPDDYTPRDHLGHGTAVASAAAANQNTGPNGITFSGMAPHAYLGNYKIAGTPGVNDGPTDDVLIHAVEDALNDGMDIATLSWGAPALTGATDIGSVCGNPKGAPCDPLAAAYEAAAKAGLAITVADGDSGSNAPNYPYLNSISSPASAPSVIGVGATTNSHLLLPTVSAMGGPQNIAADTTDATAGLLFGAMTAPIIDVTQLGNDGFACTSLPEGSLNGAFALVQRGSTCYATDKASNAQDAGAIGVVFYLPDSSTPTAIGGFVDAGVFVPVVTISNSDGLALKAYIDANPGQAVTIDAAGREVDVNAYDSLEGLSPPIVSNQLASYSSFGPTPDGAIKPDLVATGGGDAASPAGVFSYGMYLAAQNLDPNGILYSQNRYAAGDGTSFAAPVVAGAAALVKQAHPSFKAADIKSALVNAAAQDTTTDDQGNAVDVESLGAGRLDAGQAVGLTVSVAPAVVSFGYLKSGSLPITNTLTITNHGSSSVTLAVGVAPNSNVSGVTVAADQQNLTVAAGGSAALHVMLSGSVPAAGEYSGAVTLEGPGISLRVPYMFLVASGVANNVVPISSFVEGVPGQDAGPFIVQVVDLYGVPVTGQPVSFSAPVGAVTFQSLVGEPACSPSNSSSATCATDNYGIAYAEVILGSKTGQPEVIARAAGNAFGFTAYILPQPNITQVSDAAASQTPVAPGSYIAITGSNLVDLNSLFNPGGDSASAPFPLVLDFVNVSFDVPSAHISVPAPIMFVSPGQITVQVPWELEGQSSAQVKVIIDEAVYSNVFTLPLANYAPALFTNSGNIAQATDSNRNPITGSNPAVPGQTIQLFANGLGPVNNTPADGSPAVDASSTTTTPCTVTMEGQQAQVNSCGIAPGMPGEYAINVTVPANIDPGNQPVTVSVGGFSSPSGVVIPVQ